MKKISSFFNALFLSCTSPAYYNEVVKERFSSSLCYLTGLLFFLVIVSLAPLFQMIVGFDAGKTIRDVSSVYPADLTLTLANGQFFINKPLPYTILLPPEVPLENKEATRPAALVVFESDEHVRGIADVRAYNTLALITETTIYFLKNKDTGEIRAYPIPRTERAFTLSRNTVDSLLVKITETPIIKSRLYVPLAILLLFLIAYPATLAGSLVSLAFLSLFPFLATKLFLKKSAVGYGATYKIGLHAQTPLLIINAVTSRLIGFDVLPGLLYLLVFTGWTTYLISALRKSKK